MERRLALPFDLWNAGDQLNRLPCEEKLASALAGIGARIIPQIQTCSLHAPGNSISFFQSRKHQGG
jgi:hypothetical protein